MIRTPNVIPVVLIVLVCFVGALAVVNADAARKPDKISAARYSSACGDAYRGVRWYRARYNEHRATLGFSLAPPVEQAMNCRRLRERAAYWVQAAKVNRLAVERRFTLPVSNDWRTSVLIVQRAFPGTASWMLSCSAAEGGHGRWVRYGGESYYPGYEHTNEVGGPAQYRFLTWRGHYRHGMESLLERGYRIDMPRTATVGAWLSMTGQAIAMGWARWSGNDDSHWSASWSNGCR